REATAARQLLDLPPCAQGAGRAPDLLERALAQVAEWPIVDVTRIEVALGGDERGAAQRLTDDPGRFAALEELEVDQEGQLHRIDQVPGPAPAPDVAAHQASRRWARAAGEVLVVEEVLRDLEPVPVPLVRSEVGDAFPQLPFERVDRVGVVVRDGRP